MAARCGLGRAKSRAFCCSQFKVVDSNGHGQTKARETTHGALLSGISVTCQMDNQVTFTKAARLCRHVHVLYRYIDNQA